MKTIEHHDPLLIEAVIQQCDICHVAVSDRDGFPYVLPMNFGYRDGILYIHSAPEGQIIRTLEFNNRVCVAFSSDRELVFQHEQVACSYRMKSKSVLIFGEVVFLEELSEKREALDILMAQYTPMPFQYSEPAVRNVKIWKIVPSKITCKEFGAPHEEYRARRADTQK